MNVAVIGGGIFGVLVALDLSRVPGVRVDLYESSGDILNFASRVNQARLHTGMHYPRDFETARQSIEDYHVFKQRFPEAVFEIEQYYALALDSRVSWDNFVDHAERLQLPYQIMDERKWFRADSVQGLMLVPEATFDVGLLRDLLWREVKASSVGTHLATGVTDIQIAGQAVQVATGGRSQTFDKVVIATYAMTQFFSRLSGIRLPEMKHQLAEVVLGRFSGLDGIGLTVMDGQFWSTMPFGSSGLHSLTSVQHTPLSESTSGLLPCQASHDFCGSTHLANCETCPLRPKSNARKIVSHAEGYLLDKFRFQPAKSIFTPKSVLDDPDTRRTDARPSSHFSSEDGLVTLLHSGKVANSVRMASLLIESWG